MNRRRTTRTVVLAAGLVVCAPALLPSPAIARAIPPYRVTVGQLRLTKPNDVLAQIERILRKNPRSELFAFAEFATHGDAIDLSRVPYLKKDAKARATAAKWIGLTPTFGRVKALADKHGKALIVGCLEQDGDRLVSRAYFYDPKTRQLSHYDKTHVHWTEKLLRPGKKLEPLDTRFGKIGILICYDLAFVEPTRVLALRGAEIIVVVSAIPKAFHWKYPSRRLVGTAIFNQTYVIAANLGHTKKAPMGGHSEILDAEGNSLAHLRHLGTGSISAKIDLATVSKWRTYEIIDKYRHPELYGPIAAPR